MALPTPLYNALWGELGKQRRPDGAISTEVSISVADPRLNRGRPTNIPTLVLGIPDLESILAGKPITAEQQEHAIKRAAQRVSEGGDLPSYDSMDEAIKAARLRSETKSRLAKEKTMPTNGSSIGIKKYVPATPAVKRGLKKKKAPKPEGSKGGGDNSSYFQMLQIMATPTVRKGQSTLDAGMAGLAKGLALAQLLKGAGGGPKGGKVSGGTVLEKTKPTASPLATPKKKATGFGGVY